jgi:fucose permease
LTDGQSIALHGAYYAGYFIAPLTFGRLVLKQWGFKATFITGLCVYGCGTLVFWPSAVLTSFPAFLISNLIVGMGLATLEVGANPFIALCGPPQYAERRLNISQAIQAVATVVSPILARRVLFRNVLDAPSLVDVQWTYLGIALFVVLLAVAFYYMPLPEASDDDLEEIAARRQSIYTRKLGPFPVIHVTLVLGVFSQFCYVGGQEAVATAFNQYVSAVSPNFALAPADYQDVAHGLFAAGRFIAAVLNLFLTPRWILLYFYTGCIITSALAMHLHQSGGLAAIGLVFFFESAIFPTIFAITLRGLGRHTKSGSACLVAAVSGGAIFPAIMSPVIKSKGIQYAMCVVVAVFTFGTLFPIYLCSVPAARAQVNPVMSSATKHSKRKRNITFEKWGKRKSDLPAAVHVERAEKAEDEKV